MRYFLIAIVLVLVSPLFYIQVTHAEEVLFLRTLKMGMSGEDVRALQKILNADNETLVSLSGAGSPGNETTYFGPATHRALVTFQEKHREKILEPYGLMKGTGVFGLKTRVFVLSKDKDSVVQNIRKQPTTTPLSSGIVDTPTSVSSVKDVTPVSLVNPNLKNLAYAISEIRKVGERDGVSEAELSVVEQSLRDVTATTTDLTKKFLETVVVSKTQAQIDFLNMQVRMKSDSLIGKMLVRLGIAKIAYAAVPVPFGGTVIFAAPCTCSPETWLIVMNPLPPSYATSLSYILGTQLFLSHVTPPHIAQSFLGEYLAGTLSCSMVVPPGCVNVPVWGTITPFVGSSL